MKILNKKGKAPRIIRKFLPTSVRAVSSGLFHTPHAFVEGTVAEVKKEDDGDIHIRLEDRSCFIVCEIIPELSVQPPKVGSDITVWGIVREDKDHGWWEIHPVIGWH